MKFHKLFTVFALMVAVGVSTYLLLSEILFGNIISNSMFEAKETAAFMLVAMWILSIVSLLVSVRYEQRDEKDG